MESPLPDLVDRTPIWDYMQNFWMDTDPEILLSEVARVCAISKYTVDELEIIYWNEVMPAVSFNMLMLPAPEWTGFEIEWLKERILKKNRFGKPLPWKWCRPYALSWWRRLSHEISTKRGA